MAESGKHCAWLRQRPAAEEETCVTGEITNVSNNFADKDKVNLTAALLTLSISIFWPLLAQEAGAGLALPFTLTGGILHQNAIDIAGNYRAVFYPELKFGPNWFVYSAIQVGSRPSSYSASFDGNANFQIRALQAFLGRAWTGQKVSITFKAGELASVFGSFPLRYDDMANPLLDQPLGYRSVLRVRPDQLPCGVSDLARQWKNYRGGYLPSIRFGCGGDITNGAGILPVSLYGLSGAELDLASGKVDARIQLTTSSPVNPQSLASANQHLQWAAGAGYTVRPGFRIGLSAFRGPFLEEKIHELLPIGTTTRNYPASGAGADVQWAKGRWAVESEWQRFQFSYPQFVISPAVSFGYLEVKAILTPRLYAATRLGYQKYNAVQDERMKSPDPFLAGRRSYECALGYRPNRWQLLKVGYQRLKLEGGQAYDNVLGVQLVTSIQSVSKTLR